MIRRSKGHAVVEVMNIDREIRAAFSKLVDAMAFHNNDEIDIESLKDWKVRDFGFVKRFERDEKYFYVVADGEAINLALGNGTPIEIMDRTFATVVYALHYTVINDFSGVIPLPKEIDEKIGELILGHRT